MLASKLTTLLVNPLRLNKAKQVHALILLNGFRNLESQLVHQILASATSYCQNTMQYVKLILQHLQSPDIFSMGCTIRFLSQHGQFEEALALYVQLQSLRLCPNTFSLSSALKACARISYRIGGISIHSQVHKYGFSSVVYVQTALVDFYSKLGYMRTAQMVFDEIREKNVVSWNSILAGYVKAGSSEMAQCLFDQMPEKDVISWNSMISMYGKAGNMEQAYALFRQMPQRNYSSWNAMISGYIDCGKVELARSFFDAMPERNNVSYVTMISGYSKCGDVVSAQEIFRRMGEKDQPSYNALIACYAQKSRPKEALQLFKDMLQPNVKVQPDKMTLSSAISACSQLGDLKFGSWIVSYMAEVGIKMDDHLATSLIDLYTKCGCVEKARELFYNLRERDLIAYTAMILGCGINGRANDAIKFFEEMLDAKIKPNVVTFTGILSAYCHVGLVDEAYHCFMSMQKLGIFPSIDHYAIMVDLLGRAGRLTEAHKLINSMPMQPHAGVWGALLLGCSLHNNVELGEIAATHCLELEPDSAGYYLLLANIYASAGRWDDAKRLREAVEEKGLNKVPGCSWSERAMI